MKTSVSLLAVLALCLLVLSTPAVAGAGAALVFYVGATPGGFVFSASASLTNPFAIPAVNPGGLIAAILWEMFNPSPIYTSYRFISATTGKSVSVPILSPEHRYIYHPGGDVTDVVTYHTSEEQWELIRYALGSLFPPAPQGGGTEGGLPPPVAPPVGPGPAPPPPVPPAGGGGGEPRGGGAGVAAPVSVRPPTAPASQQAPGTTSIVGWTPAPAILSIAGGPARGPNNGALSFNDVEQRLAAFWDGAIPFADPFSDLYRNCWECSASFSVGRFTRDVEATLASPFLLAGAARAGMAPRLLGLRGSLLGRGGSGLLNRNDYLRIGWGWYGSATEGSSIVRIGIGSERLPIHWHIIVW